MKSFPLLAFVLVVMVVAALVAPSPEGEGRMPARGEFLRSIRRSAE